MKIPETIKIGNVVYKIIWNERLSETDQILGVSHPAYGILWVTHDSNVPVIRKEETFIHEVVHLIDASYGVFGVFYETLSSDIIEEKVDALSTCIRMVFTESNICFCKEKLEIPGTIKIGGIVYQIEFTPVLYKVRKKSVDISHLYTTIRLDNEIPHNRRESLFLWSVVETINFHFHVFPEEDGNPILEIFTNGLYQVLKDNPGLCFCKE